VSGVGVVQRCRVTKDLYAGNLTSLITTKKQSIYVITIIVIIETAITIVIVIAIAIQE